MEIKPIRSEADYERTLQEIERLWGAEEGTAEGDRLDVLATLVEAYDNEHYRMPEASGVEVLRFLMEEHGLTQGDLPEVGSQGVVSEILSGRRELNLRQIKALAKRFGVNPGAFL